MNSVILLGSFVLLIESKASSLSWIRFLWFHCWTRCQYFTGREFMREWGAPLPGHDRYDWGKSTFWKKKKEKGRKKKRMRKEKKEKQRREKGERKKKKDKWGRGVEWAGERKGWKTEGMYVHTVKWVNVNVTWSYLT